MSSPENGFAAGESSSPLPTLSVEPTVTFGPFDFDLHRLELRLDGSPVELQRRHAEALALFVRRPGEILTREELIEGLWGDTIVDYEKSLRPIINRLRLALGDSAKQSRYLATVRGEGYRFLAPVEVVAGEATPGPAAAPLPRRPGRTLPFATLGGLVLAASIATWWFSSHPTAATGEPNPRIAVLPFETRGELRPEETELVRGLALDLGADLTRRGGSHLHVALPQLAGIDDPGLEPTWTADTDHLLQGVVSRESDRFVLELSLIHGPSRRLLWSGLETAVSGAELSGWGSLAPELLAHLGIESSVAPSPPHDSSYLLRALFHLERSHWSDFQAVEDLCGQELDRNPENATAHGLIAAVRYRRWVWTLDQGFLDEARRHASAALEIDPDETRSLLVQTAITLFLDRDPDAAADLYARARVTNPREPTLLLFGMNYHEARGEWTEALAVTEDALEASPLSGLVQIESDWVRYGARRFEQALEHSDTSIRLAPRSSLTWEIRLLLAESLGRHDVAAEALESRLALSDLPTGERERIVSEARQGNTESFWTTLLSAFHQAYETNTIYPEHLALAFANLGDQELTLQWLEEAWERKTPWLGSFLMYPVLDPMRHREDFQQLHRRVLTAYGVDAAGLDLSRSPTAWVDG